VRLIDFFDRAAAMHPDVVFLQQGGVARRYSEAHASSHRIAAAIQRSAVPVRSPIGFYMPNDWRGIEALYGALRSGAPLAQVNARNSVKENAAFLNDAGAGALFFHSKYAEEAEAVVSQCPRIELVVCLDRQHPRFPALADWMAPAGTRAAEISAKPEDTSSIVATSGTTGHPKCVIQTHMTSMGSTVDMIFGLRIHEGVRNLVVAPVSHFAGTFLFALTALGSTHVIADGTDVLEIMKTIERERIEVVFLPPTLIYMMLSHPQVRDFDYSSLRAFVYAGAPMATAKVGEAVEVFGPVMMNMFGQAEANGPIAFLLPKEHRLNDGPIWKRRLQAIGRPSLLRQMEIMDDDGCLLPPGMSGEVVLRSWVNSAGYLNNPEANAELFRHGWLHTGDIGVKDEEGYVTLVDRKKDMIVSGGFNVYSSEVEHVLMSHPSVLFAAVIGVPDDKWGEAVKAVVQLKPSSSANANELIQLCKAELGSVKAPKSVEFWPELPRSATGKVIKKEIRQRYWEGRDRSI
jgi:acyl-CoA synthetase (AMP-forming)/AMP-acid ligase II